MSSSSRFFIGEVLLLIIQLWVVKHKSFTFYGSFLLLKGNMSLVGKFFLSLFDCSLVSSTPLERINPKFRGVFLFRQKASYNKSCTHLSISLNNTNEMEHGVLRQLLALKSDPMGHIRLPTSMGTWFNVSK